VLEKSCAGDLQVSGLGMDKRLAQLNEHILDETSTQNQSDNAKRDRGKRHECANLLPKDTTQGELQHGISNGTISG
jgi:hypothetical protein